MASIVVVFPKIDDAKSIKNLLVRSGFTVNGVCTTGNQTLNIIDDLSAGVVISAYRLPDMMYRELAENLPSGFELLLLASQANIGEIYGEGIVAVSMPLKARELVETVGMICANIDRRRRRARLTPKERNPEEQALIQKAKNLLMERNHMTEDEAHKYIQKCSMDSGTNMVETAQMVLSMLE